MQELSAAWDARALASAPTAPCDLELVARAKKGDTEAFSTLVEHHQQLVYNLAYRFMRENALAEDMAQEAFLKAYRLLKGFRGDCNFSTWMYRVTASVCLTELNRRKKRIEIEVQPFHLRTELPTSAFSSDAFEIIRRCVGKLCDRYATVITLYYLKETPYEEIAEYMQVPMGTLKTWMHRARNQLRKIVERELGFHGLF